MKPIYYRNNENGECFKVTISEGNTMKQIDSLLDAISFKEREFITEAEFSEYAPKTMDINIMDTKKWVPIGVLSCKYISQIDLMCNSCSNQQ